MKQNSEILEWFGTYSRTVYIDALYRASFIDTMEKVWRRHSLRSILLWHHSETKVHPNHRNGWLCRQFLYFLTKHDYYYCYYYLLF